jgi:hypothetical protein
VLLALRSASMLVCAVPVAALEYPGNSKITHEPLSSSLTLMDRDGASLSARISVPASTVVSPLTFNPTFAAKVRLTSYHCGRERPVYRLHRNRLYRPLRLDRQQHQDLRQRQDRRQIRLQRHRR